MISNVRNLLTAWMKVKYVCYLALLFDMLGTGVNAQKRAIVVHHLDTPWRPSDLNSGMSCSKRQWNRRSFFADNKVDVIIYAVEKSLDSYKFNLLYNKQLFIDQLKNNSLGKHHWWGGKDPNNLVGKWKRNRVVAQQRKPRNCKELIFDLVEK